MHHHCTTPTLLTPVWLLGLPLTALQWSIKRKYNQLKQICHFHPCVSAQRTSWSIPDAAWSIQTTAQEQSFKFIILLPCDLQLSGLQRELVPQHGADSQDQPQPPPRCAASSQLQKKPQLIFTCKSLLDLCWKMDLEDRLPIISCQGRSQSCHLSSVYCQFI